MGRWMCAVLCILFASSMESQAQVTSPATVSFAERLQFTTPEGKTVTVPPGTYRIEQLKDEVLELRTEREVVAEATAHPFHHAELIDSPRVVVVPVGQDEHHLVLLLPNGQGLDAQGWSGEIRPRGGGILAVPQSSVHSALLQSQIGPALRLGPGDRPGIPQTQDPTVLFVMNKGNWYCDRKFHPIEDGSVDNDPQTWQMEAARRKTEYQIAALYDRMMGTAKVQLMVNSAVLPAGPPLLHPYRSDKNERLVARLSLYARTRGKFPAIQVWPWEFGWLPGVLPQGQPANNPETIRNWWYAQLLSNGDSNDPKLAGFNADLQNRPQKIRWWWYALLKRHGGTLPSAIQQELNGGPQEIRDWWTNQVSAAKEDERYLDPLLILDNNADMGLQARIRILYLLEKIVPSPSTDPNVPEDVRVAIETSLTRFKYWLDEAPTDNPDGEGTFWSENHQIMFASSGYLAGQYMALHHPDWKFRSGLTGTQQMEKVKPRLLRWLDDHLRYGFNEWNSPSYYRYDIAPLVNLVDFSTDPEIQTHATMVLDLLFFDLARLTQKGNLGSTAGRAYPEAKITGWDQSMGDTVQILFGSRCPTNPIYRRSFGDRYWNDQNVDAAALASSDRYQIPMVILAIGHNWNLPFPYQERARVSVNFDEAEDYGMTFDNFDDIIFWWGRGAYFAKYTVNTSLDLIKAAHLEKQHDFKDFAPMMEVARKILDPTGGRLSMEDIVSALSFVTEGLALSRGNLYTYRNSDVMLSSVQNFRKGEMGPQLQAWQATFDNDVVVFSTYPTVQYSSETDSATGRPKDGGSHDGPNWWAGNAVNPRVVQYEDALIAAYAADQPSRLLRNAIKKDKLGFDPQTHLWWPWAIHDWTDPKNPPWAKRFFEGDTYVELAAQGHFDPLQDYQNKPYVEVSVSTNDGGGGVWYFAKRGNGYIGVFSAQVCQPTNGDWAGKELLCPNYRNAFIVQVGNLAKFGSFTDFVRVVKDSRINISKGIRKPALDQFGLSDVEVSYDLPWRRDANEPGGWKRRRLELHYDQDTPRLDGAPYCDDGFPRYESPYVSHAGDKPYGTIVWGQRQYTLQHGPYKLCHNQATGERSENCP